MALSRFRISEPNAKYNQWSILARDGYVYWNCPNSNEELYYSMGKYFVSFIDCSDPTHSGTRLVPIEFLTNHDGYE